MKKFILAMVFALFGVEAAFGATWHVNARCGRDWWNGSIATPKRSIQAAIDAASHGDWVLVAGGTYYENLRLHKRLTIHGYEPGTVKVDGRHKGSCLSINDGAAGCVIDGLTFTHGAPVNSGNKYGGGVDCHADATIRDCAFIDNGNSSTTFAGGLHTDNGSVVLVQNSLFAGNYAWACGGASLTEGRSRCTFDRCTVWGNKSDDFIGNQGGLSVANTGTIIVRGCIVWGNSGMQIAAHGSWYGRQSTIKVGWSCVQGGVAANGAGTFVNEGGNSSGNPLFFNVHKKNFHFPQHSPCWRMGHPDHREHDGLRGHMGYRPRRPHMRPVPPPPPEPVTITLDAQGGECAVESFKRQKWELIGTLPTPQRDGYDFLGWYDAAEGGNAVRTGVKAKENRTFYAHWQKRIPPLFQVAGVDGSIDTDNITGLAKLQYRLPDSNTVEGVTCAEIKLNGERLTASIQDSDEWVWQPRKLGANTFTYTVVTNSVTNTFDCTVNVTKLTYEATPEPNPPTAPDANIMVTGTGRQVPAGGKSATISTQGTGTWTASASHPEWMFLSATSGEAGKSVQFTVNANTNVSERVGYYYISGHAYQITQAGAKETTLSEDEIECESDGISGTVELQFTGRYGWEAHSDVDWITVSPTHGVGAATVTYTVAPLECVDVREGYVTIGASKLRVFQYGRRMRLSRYEETAGDHYANVFPVEIHALKSTEWTIEPNSTWLSVVYAGTGTGRKDATFAAGANPSWRARTGTVTVGTETFTVTQPGTSELEFGIAPEETTASVNGANGHIAATGTPDLPWTASSGAAWLTLTEASKSGFGNGNLYYTASPNSTLEERRGTITVTPLDARVPAQVHVVVQPAAVATRTCEGYEFRASGEQTEIGVTVSGAVSWDVSENLNWLQVVGASAFTGPGTVRLQASANTGIAERSGTIRLAGRDFTVTQKGRAFEVACDVTSFDTYSDSGYLTISTDGDIDWTIESDSGWVNFDGGGSTYSGYGSQDILFYVDEYLGDGTARTATLTVGSEKVYITQSAYEVSISPSAAAVSGNAGAGEISVSASSEEVWNALVVLGAKDWVETVTFGPWDPVAKKGKINYTYKANDSGVARRCTISINGERYELEQAARVIVNVDAATTGRGTVSGAGAQSQGDRVELTALPDEGYEFAYWTDPDGVRKEQNPLYVTADKAKSVTAHFVPLTPEITKAESGTDGVKLTWKKLAWAAEYRIYRAPTSEVPSEPLTTLAGSGECEWLDATGELEKPYWYWVEAVGSEDENPTATTSVNAAGGKRMKEVVVSPITYTNLKGATHANPATYTEETVVAFTAPGPVEGYTFAGWSPSAVTAEMKGPLTVEARWTANTYAIRYNANGGSGTMANTECAWDRDAAVALNAFERDGHEFLGWTTEPGGEVVYKGGETVRNLTPNQGAVVELYAKWWAEPRPPSDPTVSPADGSVFIGERCTVTISCATEGATVYYTTSGSTPKLTEANRYKGPFEITATTTIKAVAVKDGLKSGYATATVTKRVVTLAEAAGDAGIEFTTGGDAEWAPEVLSGGGFAAKSGAIVDGQSAWMEAKVSGSGTFSFKWKASCEKDDGGVASWDHLRVETNGVEALRIDGVTEWAEVRFAFAGGENRVRWTYAKDESDAAGEDCGRVRDVCWTAAAAPAGLGIAGDAGATVEGDAESGYVVKPGEGTEQVEVTIPAGMEAAMVTVEVGVTVKSVKANGAKLRVMSRGHDIAGWLDLAAATAGGVVNVAEAKVKAEVVKEALDAGKGATVKLEAADPRIETAATKPGLTYTFSEGATLEALTVKETKVGDGKKWAPAIGVKGGRSGFYAIGVGK